MGNFQKTNEMRMKKLGVGVSSSVLFRILVFGGVGPIFHAYIFVLFKLVRKGFIARY